MFIVSYRLSSQTAASIVNYSSDYMYQKLSLRNTPLFDPQEIKARNIRGCTIIHPWIYWDKNMKITDTLFIYDFDSTGNITREISFRTWARGERDTTYWPISELGYFSRIDSTVHEQNDQTTLTKYFIWAFDPESNEVDTGYVQKYVYDNKRRVIEFKMNGTVDYHKIYFCGTGITHHKKYRYDEKDRIIFYEFLDGREYASFEHLKNRCRIRVYDKTGIRPTRKYFIRFKVDDEAIIENDGQFTVKLTRLDKGSKLFTHFSDKQNGKGMPVREYLFIYDYFDQPGPDSKNPIVTKR